ncbi:hypothetical protein AWENTII_003102 [Aspergillus wentii]
MTWQEKIGQTGGNRRLLSDNLFFNKTLYDILYPLENGNIGYGSQANTAQDAIPIVNRIRTSEYNNSRLHIPYITVTDSVNGIYLRGGTLFPSTLAVGSSWNIPLYQKVVAAIRDENMVIGTHWVLSPELDLAQDPRNGRLGEMYGEDAYLVGEFGSQYVRTMQEKDEDGFVKVATTVKHFVYGASKGGVNTASMHGGLNYIFNEVGLPFIKVIQEAKPLSLMASYASVDCVPVAANEYLLQDILRNTIGFDGLIMSDAGEVLHLYTQSKVAGSEKRAALWALQAGLAIELSPGKRGTFPTLIESVNNTKIASLVDKAAHQVLEIKFATGQFERPLPSMAKLNATLRLESHLEVNRNISREAIVLLQNDGTLPLPRNTTNIALLGPFADIINAGSYASFNSTDRSLGHSFKQSLQNEFGADRVQYIPAVDFIDTSNRSGIAGAVAAAKEAGLAVLMLGSLSVDTDDPLFSKRTDGEFFTHADLGFPGLQQDLIDAVLDTGVPTILILSGGQPFVLNNSTLRANAIIHSFLGGEFTGDALVEIIKGTVNPSGKLTISMPQHSAAIPINYNYLPSDNEGGMGSMTGVQSPAWQFPLLTRDVPMPFGYGLSYTTFNISKPIIKVQGQNVTVAVSVTNAGKVRGSEVVQVYFREKHTKRPVETPVKRLVRFAKVEIEAGHVERVTFTIPIKELGYYFNTKWGVDGGLYTFWVGSSSKDQDLQSVEMEIEV